MTNKNLNYKTQSIIYILVILGFIVVANYVSNFFFKRVDLTENRMYSLSKETKQMLRNMDDIVNIKVYFTKELPPNLIKLRNDVDDMLKEFAAYSGKNLRITWNDPKDDKEAQQKVKEYGIPQVQMSSFKKDQAQVVAGYLGLAVIYGGKKEVLPVIKSTRSLEYDLAQAILKVSRTVTPKVAVLKTDTTPYFDMAMRMQMRGQLPQDPTETKYEPIYKTLKETYDVKTVALSNSDSISNEYKTLVIPGGKENFFTDKVIAAIDKYFMNGGNLIVLADAMDIQFNRRGVSALKQSPKILELLAHYGVKVKNNLVLDPKCGMVQIPQNVGGMTFNIPLPYPYFVKIDKDGINQDNPAVTKLTNIVFPWISSLKITADTTLTKADILVRSSSQSWTVDDNFDLNPQQKWKNIMADKVNELSAQNLIVHLSGKFKSYSKDAKVKENPAGHLVVVGDSDFLTKQQASSENLALFTNLVDWLTQSDNLISIRSKNISDRTINSNKLKGFTAPNAIRMINLFLMPVLLVLVGIFISLKRREK